MRKLPVSAYFIRALLIDLILIIATLSIIDTLWGQNLMSQIWLVLPVYAILHTIVESLGVG